MLQVHPDQVTDKELLAVFGDGAVPLSTARLYLEKISPVVHGQFDKNQYMDQAIEDLFNICEGKIADKKNAIDKIKEKITKLEEMADMEEMIGSDNEAPEMFDQDGNAVKVKVGKKKMCKDMLKFGKCKNTSKTCKYAHNPIELELTTIADKQKNLNKAQKFLERSMKLNKSLQDWLPSGQKSAEDCKFEFKFHRFSVAVPTLHRQEQGRSQEGRRWRRRET